MAENVRVLKIQREHQARHVRGPSDGPVRQTGPDPDEAEADLDGSADGSCAHYLAWDRTTATFPQRQSDYHANDAARKLSIEFRRAITPVRNATITSSLRRSLSVNRNYARS